MDKSNLTKGMVMAICHSISKKYQSVGIASITFNSSSSALVFTLSNGDIFTISLNLTSSGIIFDPTQSELAATNVQDALNEIVNYIEDEIFNSVGYQLVLIGTGDIENNVAKITIAEPQIFVPYLTNSRRFFLDINLTVTGDPNYDVPVQLVFGETSYNLYGVRKGNGAITLRDLYEISQYSNETGYRYMTDVTFFTNEDVTGFWVIPTVSQSDVLSLTDKQMHDYSSSGVLPQKQLAICKEITDANLGYVLSGLYRFEITYPDTYVWNLISADFSSINTAITTLQQNMMVAEMKIEDLEVNLADLTRRVVVLENK